MLTLRDILSWDILSGHAVIAGGGGLEAEVRSITVIDAPDAVNWVKPQEFVVTSTYPVHQGPDALVALIEQLASRNAAGLGVKLTRFLREIPASACRRAEELGLAIVSLPGPLAWSDLIGAIFSRLDQRGGEAAHLSAIYRGFSQHRARLGSLRELSELVATFVNLPVVLALEDEAGLQVESRGVTPVQAEALAEILIHSAEAGMPQEAAQEAAPVRLAVGSERLAVARTGMGPNGGGIVALLERDQRASEPDLECLRLSVGLLQTLLDSAESGQRDARGEARLLTDLLDPLLAPEAKALLVANGLPEAAAWQMVVARIFDPDTVDRALLALRLRQLARRRSALFRMDEDGGGCLLAIPVMDADPRAEEAAMREVSQVFAYQGRRAPGFRYGLGQAGPSGLSEAVTLRREAEEALAFGTRLNGFNRMNRHDDLLLMRLLAHPAVMEQGRASFLRLLEPLLDMGEPGKALLDTLRVWLQEDESMPRTAERLGLHVNTVRQRLNRCRAVLGLADFGTSKRLRLHAALQMLPILVPGASSDQMESSDRKTLKNEESSPRPVST